MITLYHTPISLNSRRVWVALLEKGLPFDLVEVNLTDGEQFQPEFLAMNPFHHIPVLVDGDTTVIESFAILDYLEAKYPEPALMPKDASAIATVRMVQMVTLNELMSALGPLTRQFMGFGQVSPEEVEKAKQQAAVSLRFFEGKLGAQPFFGGDQPSLADIILGIVASWFDDIGISL
ncbi:MAG TPA: glutathione S-transferase family protein, partial [Trichocoleus sp.]